MSNRPRESCTTYVRHERTPANWSAVTSSSARSAAMNGCLHGVGWRAAGVGGKGGGRGTGTLHSGGGQAIRLGGGTALVRFRRRFDLARYRPARRGIVRIFLI